MIENIYLKSVKYKMQKTYIFFAKLKNFSVYEIKYLVAINQAFMSRTLTLTLKYESFVLKFETANYYVI